MHVHITIDDTSALTDADKAVLRALIGEATTAVAEEPKKPRRQMKAATLTPKETSLQKDEEPAAPAEDPWTGEPIATEHEKEALETGDGAAIEEQESTLEDAVARATELVSQGKSKEVKDALGKVGAKRVTELTKPADIATFLQELS